jgi:DNA-binding NtrC family response regulator
MSQGVILMVDDSSDLRSAVATYLRLSGFTVFEASNARDALTTINTGLHLALVCTDVNMPGSMDGQALALWLADYQPGLPVILTSGESPLTSILSTPGRKFIRKPYELGALERAILALIEPQALH